MKQLSRLFWRQRNGSAAVEFALIAPIMLSLFLGMVELSDMMIADRKVTNVTSTVADLVGQAKEISDSDIGDIFAASTAILNPFDAANATIRVTSADIDFNGDVTVAWSDGYNTSARAVGSALSLPTGIGSPGSSVIFSEVTYTHQGVSQHIIGITKQISDNFYVRPRRVLSVSRVN